MSENQAPESEPKSSEGGFEYDDVSSAVTICFGKRESVGDSVQPVSENKMETVALDTSEVFEEALGRQASESLEPEISRETDLRRYFSVDDTSVDPASNFFDSFTSCNSSMMKSVSETNMFQGAIEEDITREESLTLKDEDIPITLAEEATEDPIEVVPMQAEEAVKQTANITPSIPESIPEMSDAASQPTMFSSISNQDEKSTLDKSTSESKDITSSNEDQPSLSKFFSDDKSGQDQEGKAFFDVLASIKTTEIKTETSEPVSASFPLVAPASNVTQIIHNIPPTPTVENSYILLFDTGESRPYDGWIPSEKTLQLLESMKSSYPGTYFPDKDQLTMPGIVIEENQTDPVISLLQEFSEEQAKQRCTLSADDVAQNEDGLRQLIGAQCYHAAINLTTRLLTLVGQGPGSGGHPSRHSPYSLQLWYTRLALFVKLRKFSLAEVESEAFGDLDKLDLYYEFYVDSYPGMKGSMVPFAFRLLLSELPQYQGNFQAALNKLYKLLSTVHKIIENVNGSLAEDGSKSEISEISRKMSLKLWKERECQVYYSILNCLLGQKDYLMAVKIVNVLLEKDTGKIPQLFSAIGRIFLQLGDLETAQDNFNKAEVYYRDGGLEGQLEILLNRALMALAHNSYNDAYKYYEEANKLQPINPIFVNNMAVCLLYMGRLKDSLSLLENMVQGNPSLCLHEGLLFNVCTLYELQSSVSLSKKLGMLSLVGKHAGDNFNTASLKIQTPSKLL